MKFSHVLCACDLSEESIKAIEAFALKDIDSTDKISLVAIVPEWMPPGLPMDSIGNVEALRQYREETIQRAEAQLKELTSRAFQNSVTASYVVPSVSAAAQELVDFAKRHSCDLIVMASHGAGALSNLFIGSTVQRVIRLAACPVLVIPKFG